MGKSIKLSKNSVKLVDHLPSLRYPSARPTSPSHAKEMSRAFDSIDRQTAPVSMSHAHTHIEVFRLSIVILASLMIKRRLLRLLILPTQTAPLYYPYNGRNCKYASALSFSDSWQRKVLLASQYVMSATSTESDDDNNDINQQDWFFLQMDNTSNRCMTFPTESCSCEPRILLKWARILFYKVARTYVAKPLLLALLPLCVGVLVGIWIGKTSKTETTTTTTTRFQ